MPERAKAIRRQALHNIIKILLARGALLVLALVLVAWVLAYIPKPQHQEVTVQPEAVQAPAPTQAPTEYPPVVYDTMIGSMDWSGAEETMLLKMCMAEAESESTCCKALVIICILNRVWSDEFPDTIYEVITQENQFTPIWDGRYYTAEPDDDCYAAMELVKSGWDQSQGCMWYESCDGGSTWHQDNLEHVYTVGHMRFYRSK